MQKSETLFLAAILTFSGGLQDAYSYFVRDKVFANAQTGNIVLMASKLFDGKFNETLHYLIPLIAFACGIFVAEQIQGYYKEAKKLHWRQTILIFEIISLTLAGILPTTWNIFANSLVSFSCSMQVQAFRSTHGISYASTMCIGNMRAGVASFSHWTRTHNKQSLYKALHYILIIILFACGAAVGYKLAPILQLKTIWLSSILLMFGFTLMFTKGQH